MLSIKVSKRMLWVSVGVAGAVAGVLVLAGLFFTQPKSEKSADLSVFTRKNLVNQEQPSPSVDNLVSYKDPLGFSFNYPWDTTINTHPEDKVNYADVELSVKPTGSIKFIVSDTAYQDLDIWLKKDPEVKLANFLDSKIGFLDAKKVYLDVNKKLLLVSLWEGMLFKIEITPSDNQNLLKTADNILASLNVPLAANYTDSTSTATNNNSGSMSGDTTSASSDASEGDEEVIQ